MTSNTGVSTDTEESHLAWIRTPRKRGGLGHMQIPLVADVKKTISADYGSLLAFVSWLGELVGWLTFGVAFHFVGLGPFMTPTIIHAPP